MKEKRQLAVRQPPDKEHVSVETPRNPYYETVSARLGIAQVILYLALFAFVVISLAANSHLITYRNFYYFFKDLNASAERVDVLDVDSVSYQTDEQQSFTLYRKGLAVAGNTSVTIFTASGRQTLGKTVSFRDPAAVGSGKYLLVYEINGSKYALYNSNTCLYEAVSEYPITGAAVSDSGMYALISSSSEYTSVVSLYSNRFTLLNRYNRTGYVMDVSLDGGGDLAAILTSSSDGAAFTTSLLLAKPGESTAIAEIPLGSSVGLSCGFTSSGDAQVLCADHFYQLTPKGTIKSEYSFHGNTVNGASLCRDGCVVCLSENAVSTQKTLLVFDKNGKTAYQRQTSERISQPTLSGSRLFYLTDGGVTAVDLSDGNVVFTPCETYERVLLAVDEHEVLCCSPQKAVYLTFR